MITECGGSHETKFKVVRNFIAKYLPLPAISISSPSPKSLYGTIQFVSYATQLKYFTSLVELLFPPWMQDRDPITLINLHPLKNNPNLRLDIFVENKIRCCGVISAFKYSLNV